MSISPNTSHTACVGMFVQNSIVHLFCKPSLLVRLEVCHGFGSKDGFLNLIQFFEIVFHVVTLPLHERFDSTCSVHFRRESTFDVRKTSAFV
jgi:hypothetical protein